MTQDTHRPIVDRLLQAIDANDLGAVKSLINPDCALVTPQGTFHGPEQTAAWMKPFLDAFPGIQHKVVGYVEGADGAAFELRITGKHTQPMASPMGPIPPTNRDIALRSCSVVRIAGGKLASYHIYFDQMEFMGQLGLSPGK